MGTNYKIALLIDCDNVSHQSIEGVLQELAKYGVVNGRHARGNWNGPQLSGWIDVTAWQADAPSQPQALSATDHEQHPSDRVRQASNHPVFDKAVTSGYPGSPAHALPV